MKQFFSILRQVRNVLKFAPYINLIFNTIQYFDEGLQQIEQGKPQHNNKYFSEENVTNTSEQNDHSNDVN